MCLQSLAGRNPAR